MPRAGRRQELSSRPDGSESPHETAKPALEEPSHVTPPPLSELRGTFFSAGLKELDMERHAVQQSAEVELLMRAITPFEPLFNHTKPAHSSGHACTPELEAEHTAAAHTFIPIAGLEIAPAAANEADAHSNGSRHVAKQRESRSSKSAAPESNGTRRGGNGDQARRGQNQSMREQGDVLDDVQILPSKRGQYKKNGWEHRNGQR